MSIEMIMSTPEHIIVEYALCDVPITRGTFTWDKYRGTLFIDKAGTGGEDSFRNSVTTVHAGGHDASEDILKPIC